MKSLLNFFKYLDFFSQDTSFITETKERYRSYQGVIISIIILISVAIISFIFGQEIYQRKLPLVSQAKQYTPNSQVKLKDWMFFLQFKVGDPTLYFDYSTFKMVLDDKGQFAFFGDVSHHKLELCTKEHFKPVFGKIDDSIIENYLTQKIYCLTIDEEDNFQNEKSTNNSTSLDLAFVYCNPNAKKCADDIEKIKQETYIQFYFLNSYVDSLDHKKPSKYFFGVLDHQINNKFLKRRYIQISNNFYHSDDGWIFENTNILHYYQLEKENLEINSLIKDPNHTLWINLTSPNFYTKYTRSYLKVQDLFAKIGGMINALMILGHILFSHYLRFNMILNLSEDITARVDFKTKPHRLAYNKDINNEVELNLKIVKLKEKITGLSNKLNEIVSTKNSNTDQIRKDKNFENETKENKLEAIAIINPIELPKNNLIKNVNAKKIKNINSNNIKDKNNTEDKFFNTNESQSNNYIKITENYNEVINEVRARDNNLLKIISKPTVNIDKPKIFSPNENNKNVNKRVNLDFNNEMRKIDIKYYKYIYYLFCCKNKNLKEIQKVQLEMYALLDFNNFLNYIYNEYHRKMNNLSTDMSK